MYLKRFILLFLAISLSALCLSGCTVTSNVDIADYCNIINQRLTNADFFKAFVSDGVIKLYDSDDILIDEILFDAYDKSKRIVYIRKEGSRLYFILGGSVDDEYGIMFINDADNDFLDGIHSVERVGGNSYEYSTS